MEPAGTKVGTVEKLVSGGDGLVRQDGLIVFVPGVLPGERIEYRPGRVRKGFSRGILIRILEPSPSRRQAPCELYGRCGGCDWMHLKDEAQGPLKAELVVEAFRRLGKQNIPLPSVVSGRPWAYRSRFQFHRSTEKGPLGLMGRGSDRVIPVRSCPVAAPGFDALLRNPPERWPLGRTNAFCVSGEAFWEGQDRQVTLTVSGKRLVSSLDGFFQSNLELLPSLIAEVLDGLPKEGRRVLDLYGGAGLFGAFLADRFQTVVEVEQNEAALELARVNVSGPLHEFYPLTLEAWLAGRNAASEDLDGVVVDPPRTGLSADVTRWLGRHPTKNLVYVSCNPDTLARDAGLLIDSGWKLQTVKVFDFYPQTAHIEAVARFVGP